MSLVLDVVARRRALAQALALVVSLGAPLACGPSFDDCESRRTCAQPPTEGQAGHGGQAGVGSGGHAGEPAAASGGEAGEDAGWAPPDVPCVAEGATACAAAADGAVWSCAQGDWIRVRCAEGERCDSTEPACRPIAEGCEERQPGEAFCDGEYRSVCGSDLVTRTDLRCSGACVDGECAEPVCGDGVVQEDEACDDGNDDDSDACARCERARCGDGFTWDGIEQCDDGNERNDDACVGTCQEARCGDGFLRPGEEECDFGAKNSDTGSCLVACREATCGDGLVWEAEEECDDENDVATDGCRSCTFAPTKLAAGNAVTCAVFGDGSLKCWGSNSVGQLGLGDTKNRGDGPGELGEALPVLELKGPVSDVALGLDHACAIGGDRVSCWGGGSYGQLGQGNDAAKTLPAVVETGSGVPTALALGQWFSCVLLDSGAVRCWGRGERGALGTGDTEHVGDAAGEMGVKLRAVDLTRANAQRAHAISARRHRACVIVDGTERVACWGDSLLFPTQVAVPLSPAAALAVGGGHRCILGDVPSVECWGDGSHGQLGSGSTLDRNSDEAIVFVPFPGSSAAESVAAGDDFTCALSGGKVYCWGKAGPALGRPEHTTEGLDLGDEPGEIAAMTAVDLGPDAEVHAIAAGFDHVCALLTTGDVKCWGANDSGQLGTGDTEPRGDDAAEMGASLLPVRLR